MSLNTYPETVTELLDEGMRFQPGALQAVSCFAKSKPWRGTLQGRKAKFRKLNRELAMAHQVNAPRLIFSRIDGSSSGASCYVPSLRHIVMTGKLSVVTFLHEFAHALGMGEREATAWSVNLFRRCFPRQYGRLIHVGHKLVRPEDAAGQIASRSVR